MTKYIIVLIIHLFFILWITEVNCEFSAAKKGDKTKCVDKTPNCMGSYKKLCSHFREFALVSCRKSCNFCEACEYPPPVPEYGSVQFTTDVLTVIYQCNKGYYLSSGDQQRTCKGDYDNGTWAGELPTCSPVYSRNCTQEKDCSSLVNSMCIQNQSEHSTVTPATGYSRQCLCKQGHYYNETSHSCYKDCGEPLKPTNGSTNASNGTKYLAIATYHCNTGFDLTGNSTAVCNADGNWSYGPPLCNIKVCQLPGKPEHVELESDVGNRTDFVYNTTIRYKCVAGYGFQRNTTRHETKSIMCQDSSSFTDFETCNLKVCQMQVSLKDEHIVIVTDIKNKTEFEYNTTLLYTCAAGYGFERNATTQENKTIMCQENASFSDFQACQQKDCGHPSTPTNGTTVTSNGTKYLAVATYNCNKGFYLVGNTTAVCNADGNWSYGPPRCNIKVCQLPGLPEQVKLESDVDNRTDFVYNTTLRYRCVAGYGFQRNATTHETKTITCQDSSSFTEFETCNLKVCQLPVLPQEKRIEVVTDVKNKAEFEYNTTLLYTCAAGYGFERNANIQKNKTIICQENASFSDFQACVRKDCGPLPKVDLQNKWHNVTLTNGSSDTFYQSTAIIYCLEGYRIKGGENGIVSFPFTCQSNRTWGLIPQCEKKDCSQPGTTDNGNYKLNSGQTLFSDNVTYTCNQGYETTDMTFITCNSTGKWSSPSPNCKDINECARYTANCHRRADCTNTNGSYTCKCQEGFRDISGEKGLNCEDKDECANITTNKCNINGSQCINYPGGFLCLCDDGWTGDNCEKDINECDKPGCGVNAFCTNYLGGYNCTCKPEFPKGDPKIHCYENVIIELKTHVNPFRGDNQLIDAKPIHYRFPYFGDEFNSYRPNMNGFFTLGYQPVYEHYGPETPEDWKTYSRGNTVIAPFWTNIDSTNLTGGLYVHLLEYYTNYGQTDSQHQDLSELGTIFACYLNLTHFKPRVALVATWLNVTQSSYIEPSRLIRTHNATMQAILISDGIYSYLMLNYDHEQWSFQMDNDIPSSAGYSQKDKTGFIIATSKNFSQLNAGTNVHPGLNGRWIYNVSSSDSNRNAVLRNESECIAFSRNETIRNWITEQRGLSYPCPCSEQQIQLDYSYRTVLPMYKNSQSPPNCYEAWFFNNDGVKQTCCYSYGALKKENIGGGFASFENDIYNTTQHFYKCCDENTNRHLCHLFYEMNPSDDCSRFQPADEPSGRYRRFIIGNMQNRSENVIIELKTRVNPFKGDDQLIDAKPIQYRFPYFGDEFNSYRPNMNGFFTLGYLPVYKQYGPETPEDWKRYSQGNIVIAPFWTNIDSTNLTGGLYVHLLEYNTNYETNDSQHQDLSKLGNIFAGYLNLTVFTPRVALVATWLNVTQSSHIEPSRLIRTHNATMQAILISDGIYSYLMFNYDHAQWSFQMDKSITSSAGYSLKNRAGFITATSKNFNQLNKGTNVYPGLNGRWIYNVSGSDFNKNAILRNESECIAFSRNKTIRNWITAKRLLSYPCPCSQQQMQLDYIYHTMEPMYKNSQSPPICYEAWFFNSDGVKQTCCYSYGALKKDAVGGGFASFENDVYDTTQYFYKCCDENTDRQLCHLFYEMNPSDDCSRFQPADEPIDRRSIIGSMRSRSGKK